MRRLHTHIVWVSCAFCTSKWFVKPVWILSPKWELFPKNIKYNVKIQLPTDFKMTEGK